MKRIGLIIVAALLLSGCTVADKRDWREFFASDALLDMPYPSSNPSFATSDSGFEQSLLIEQAPQNAPYPPPIMSGANYGPESDPVRHGSSVF